MKILQISSATSFAGGERHVVDLTNALAARGHELYAAVRPNSPLMAHLRIPSENIKTLPLRNALDAQSAHGLARIVSRCGVNVVHAHMARDYSLAAYATQRNSKTKFVVTRHVLFPLNRFHKRTLAHAFRVIAVSSAVARHVKSQRLLSPERIVIIRNGIDVERLSGATNSLDRAAYRCKLGIPEDCVLIGTVGELRRLKRHDDFIRAAAIVAREIPSAHFVLAGSEQFAGGEIGALLKKLVDELELGDRFHFLGWLDDAASLLGSMEVFVSASETESFGLVIAEAMAAGTAVVSTATEGARELIVDEETGLLVPVRDVEKMAKAITSLLVDEKRRSQFAVRGRNRVAEHFSLNRMIDETEAVYEAL
jgi:L-malate glycosyltransferase